MDRKLIWPSLDAESQTVLHQRLITVPSCARMLLGAITFKPSQLEFLKDFFPTVKERLFGSFLNNMIITAAEYLSICHQET